MNEEKHPPEIKEFQEETSLELTDKLYNLGKEAILDFGEKSLGEFLITLALQYKTKLYELNVRRQKLEMLQYLEALKAASEGQGEETEEDLKEVFAQLKKHDKLH